MTKSYTDSVIAAFTKKSTEPAQRMVGGRFGWATHRFPIKGGISFHESMAIDMRRPNRMYELLVKPVK